MQENARNFAVIAVQKGRLWTVFPVLAIFVALLAACSKENSVSSGTRLQPPKSNIATATDSSAVAGRANRTYNEAVYCLALSEMLLQNDNINDELRKQLLNTAITSKSEALQQSSTIVIDGRTKTATDVIDDSQSVMSQLNALRMRMVTKLHDVEGHADAHVVSDRIDSKFVADYKSMCIN